MKKWISLWLCVLGLVILVYASTLMGATGKVFRIDLPFEVDTVENVEMYHFAGTPGYVEKKVIVAEETVNTLYDMFEGLSLRDKKVKETGKATTTSFRFNLADGTSYELFYSCYGVKKGNLKSSTGNFECFASADIGSYWSNIDLEAVQVEASELPK